MSAKEERTDRPSGRPRVTCNACDFAWYSASMAHGLRTLGACPRCHGELTFDEDRPAAADLADDVGPAAPPHLALGLPRGRAHT
jgi:uncharacterized paraquat-inducible protein A